MISATPQAEYRPAPVRPGPSQPARFMAVLIARRLHPDWCRCQRCQLLDEALADHVRLWKERGR